MSDPTDRPLLVGDLLGLLAGPETPPEKQSLLAALMDAPRYYLGPTGIPERAGGLFGALEYTDAGDMAEAARASRELWHNPNLENAGRYATAAAAMMMPAVSAKMVNDGVDVAGDLGRFWADQSGAVGPGKPIKAYHGSPHDFDRFQMDKIGTGEGAQAYGHGLYFAESEDVARNYRDSLADQWQRQVNNIVDEMRYEKALGTPITIASLKDAMRQSTSPALRGLAGSEDAVSAIHRVIRGTNADASVSQDAIDAYGALERIANDNGFKGSIYEVNIHANPDDFLDWDAPLSKQSPTVQRKLMNIPGAERFDSDWAGAQLYESNALTPGQYRDKRTAAQTLQYDAGIPGIKYRDQFSRGTEGGTRNYVVFDENLVEIVRKYGIAGAAAMLGVSVADVEESMGRNQ